jgi:formylglycine-generating enzyme required for sulfatase activity
MAFPASGATRCAPDAVRVGAVCVDRYEASVWRIPAASTALVHRVQLGKATAAELVAAGAVQLGCTAPPFSLAAYGATFPGTGNWTEPAYAASLPGVLPSTCATWFQAVQACALSGKRLLTNQEWQRTAAGTPPDDDDGATVCNTSATGGPVSTGSRTGCVSRWGAFDLAGNAWEWTDDPVDVGAACDYWPSSFGDDISCFSGAPANPIIGALARGGHWNYASGAGIFALNTFHDPSFPTLFIGFRCGR